jgi:hypothetical protein
MGGGGGNNASMRKKRKKEQKKWRNIKNTNKYATYTTRMKTNNDERTDL